MKREIHPVKDKVQFDKKSKFHVDTLDQELAAEVVKVGERLAQFLRTETPRHHDPWYESIKLRMQLQVDALVEKARNLKAGEQS